MAVPKNKKSKSKRDMRRTHDKLKAVTLVECPRCHSKKIAHRVCEKCGYYNNKEIIKIAGKEKSKEKGKETASTKTTGGRVSKERPEAKNAREEKAANE